MLSVNPSSFSAIRTFTIEPLFPLDNPVYSCPWANTDDGRSTPTRSFSCPCPLFMVTQKASLKKTFFKDLPQKFNKYTLEEIVFGPT